MGDTRSLVDSRENPAAPVKLSIQLFLHICHFVQEPGISILNKKSTATCGPHRGDQAVEQGIAKGVHGASKATPHAVRYGHLVGKHLVDSHQRYTGSNSVQHCKGHWEE